VAAGILLTRILGLVRERVFAHYFGSGFEADAYRAALKIPNVIRNLLGEGTLSASFIPVYAAAVETGDEEGARRVAGTVASLIVVVASLGAILGIVLAPVITDMAAPGFSGETRDLTVTLVRILFPMSALMIMSAWCLGVLNTHRRFFLSYAAPTLWNVAQIATLIGFGVRLTGVDLVTALAWGALAGGALQLLVQLPAVFRLVGRVRWSLKIGDERVRTVVRKWLPVVFGAGVLQISSIIDTLLGSLVGPGAVASLGYAQLIAILPVSLFGVSVAAAALPELSREATSQTAAALRARVADGTQRVVFFILPSAVAMAVFGRHLVAPLFQTGEFGPTETALVASIVAVYGIAVPAQATVRLLTSGHYALGDTRTPVRIAILSVIVSATSAFLLMRVYGVVGIAMGAVIAAYLNAGLNYRTLARRTEGILRTADIRFTAVSVASVLAAAALAYSVESAIAPTGIWSGAFITLGVFGVTYLGLTFVAGHPVARGLPR